MLPYFEEAGVLDVIERAAPIETLPKLLAVAADSDASIGERIAIVGALARLPDETETLVDAVERGH